MITVPRARVRATLLCAAAVAVTAATAAPVAAGTAPVGACGDGEGVTVVVDFTDLGGEVEVGCAAGDPASGREALAAAGFTPADGTYPGLICTIDGLPDPCPAEFAGSYWAYWSADQGGDWEASQVGADDADPVPGAFEGWRYNDGATAPGVATAALAAAADGGAGGGAALGSEPGGAAVAAGVSAGLALPSATFAGLVGVAALGTAIGVVVWRRRGGGPGE